ncbi:MAG: S49 family peptidase [Phycisphaerae bacterium]|jgi:protease-4
MDEQNAVPPAGAHTPPPPPPYWAYPPRKSWTRRFFGALGRLVFFLSILLNVYLFIALGTMAEGPKVDTTTLRPGRADQVIAVYDVRGVIDEKAVESFRQFYRHVMGDPAVKAVVLRIDSPGGGVAASDEIHAMVGQLQTKGNKKVIVSMGGVAASGGYYIACGAQEIYAEETTITGSIGVLMGWPVLKGTLDKLGIEMVMMKSQDARGWKDAMSSLQRPDPRQRAYLQTLLDTMQKRFEGVVREGRGQRLVTRKVTYTIEVPASNEPNAASMPVTQSDTEPLNGKIYLGAEAKAMGLIDAIGYQDAAIDRAAALAELNNPRVLRYESHRSLLQRMMGAEERASLRLGPELLDQLQSPRMMMLWKAD